VWCALALQRIQNDSVDGFVLMLFMFFEYGRLDKRKWRIALMMKGGTRLLKRGNSPRS
jgi:predicted RNA-binding protein with PUA domain